MECLSELGSSFAGTDDGQMMMAAVATKMEEIALWGGVFDW